LYGGWHENGALTAHASEVLQMLRPASLFPVVRGGECHVIVRGQVELVESLLQQPAISWQHTYQKRSGSRRIRLQSPLPHGCVGAQDTCLARSLARFTRSRTSICPQPTCSVTNAEAFFYTEQKMVDTLLACDLIYLAQERPAEWVVVASDDWDLLPPLVAASGSSRRVSLVRRNTERAQPYDAKLESLGVAIVNWGA
jgi:hypothetical protein